jgi:tRNA A-37 threonylcarbamoyl transferase component Bud32
MFNVQLSFMKRRVPWWLYLAGLSYIGTTVFFLYLFVRAPIDLIGYVATYSDDGMLLHSVDDPNTAIGKAGLRAGDLVLSINDRPLKSPRDLQAAAGNSWGGQPEYWLVLRDGVRTTVPVVPVVVSLREKLALGYAQLLSLIFIGLFLGLLIAWKRPHDAVARLGAWFILTASLAPGLPLGWAVLWRSLPRAVQLLLWFPQFGRFVLEGILLSFFVLFPRRLITRRWMWLAIWVPVLITLPWRAKAFYAVIYPGDVTPVPAWILQVGFLRTILYFVVGIGILAMSYRRFLDPNEKRRVRILMAGTAISLVCAVITVWLDAFSGRMIGIWNVFVYAIVPLYSACPVSLAYAILRHRVLDISVIVRQGLQYALARGGVIGFVPALAAVFVADLALNSEQRVSDIFRSRGWFYALAAVLALVAYWKRQEWLQAIDRRFFRERYSAQQLLRDVVGQIRTAPDFNHAASAVVERIGAAFHPEFVSVMIRPPDQPAYRGVATLPPEQAAPRLMAESKVIGLLHVLDKPLEFLSGDSDWLDQRLPPEESEFVRNSRIDLLVPIAKGAAQTEALMALGVKRSEEPYTHEDQELLEAIAGSLSVTLGQAIPAARRSIASFKECPECGICYDETALACDVDGARLKTMQMSRVLANRYRLERRRGQGGMGTIYEVTDNALERRVAIKLIREDWTDSAEALQRFRREARAAASFAHPNVVTIYDYGVDGETRAFLVMELLEGVTLREELKQNQRLASPRVIDIFRGVCAAVEAAHARNLIHRDLKPENIFLTGNTVKVLDFGIAKFLPTNDDSAPTAVFAGTRTGVLVGTPAYMSPEQLLGEELHVCWDLWALSVVAYEALTGALPFASGPDGRRAILEGIFTPVEEPWQSFFERSFAEDRNKRPQSAAEFLSQLENILGM